VEESAAAAINEASVSSEQAGEQTIPSALSTADESTADESAAVESEVIAPAVSSSGGSDADSVAATSTAVTSGSNASTPVAAGAAVWNSIGPAVQDESVGGLESAAATVQPTLAEVIATMSTGMEDTVSTVVVTLGSTVATVVISLGNTAAAIPPAIWALPFSPTPISDVIALLDTVLASVTESATAVLNSVTESATAVLRFSGEVAALFSTGTIGTGAVLIGESGGHRVDVVPAGSMPSATSDAPLPFLGLVPQQSAEFVVDRVSGFAAFTPTALATAFRAPLMAAPASLPAGAGEYQSIFDRTFGALLVPLSLWALATGALPGLVGLLVVFGAGARVGYRQAKAGFALRMVGIARFAGSGPLGVVRSGSFVEPHQRGLGAGHQRSPHWYRLGDQAA
ncbi:MAG: hypothetical protein ACPGIJ_13190, partial [Mycobacterium sp.]